MSPADAPFADPAVEARFAEVPEPARSGLLALRRLIFETAEAEDAGPLQETLKWGQPAYLTAKTKSGSTIRIAPDRSGGYAIYAHCQTTIIPEFRSLFPDGFDYEGNRAIHFRADEAPPVDKLRLLVRHALTYHRKRR